MNEVEGEHSKNLGTEDEGTYEIMYLLFPIVTCLGSSILIGSLTLGLAGICDVASTVGMEGAI